MAAPGDRLGGRYELIEVIGAGGMAVVWRARDLRLRRTVAVKILRPQFADDAEFVDRFESEARHAASLAHPNVAAVYDTGVDDAPDGRTRFIVMELVDGPSVAEVLRAGPLPPGLAVDVAIGAARALAAAHRRGIVHRDVKPGNLLVGPDGRVRLADFGIARALASSRLTTAGTMFGSAPYMSPEQAAGGEVLPASDLYSLGLVLHEMLLGTLPPRAAAGQPGRLAAGAAGMAPDGALGARTPGGELPAGLAAIIERALAPDPARRHPSARALADALETVGRRIRRAERMAGPARGTGRSGRAAAVAWSDAARPDAARPDATRPDAVRPVAAGPLAATGLAAAGLTDGGSRSPSPGPTPGRPTGSVGEHDASGGAVTTRLGRPSPGRPERRPLERPRRRAPLGAGLLLVVAAFALVGTALAAVAASRAGAPGAGSSPLVAAAPSTGSDGPSQLPASPGSSGPAAATSSRPTVPDRPSPATSPSPTPRSTPSPTARPTAGRPETPANAVLDFYDAVSHHDWNRAISRWSARMQREYPPRQWLIGRFAQTTRIEVTRLRTVARDDAAGTATVAVTIVEDRTDQPSPQTLSGSWALVRVAGRWLLDQPHF